MAKLFLSSDFFHDFHKLQKPVQAQVSKLVEKFRALSAAELRAQGAGVNLERYAHQKDPHARTVRLGSSYRGIVYDAGDDELFILTKVLPHVEADLWMMKNEFKANPATGALEIIDVAAMEAAVDQAVRMKPADSSGPKLFAHRKDKEFRQLGVNELLLPALRVFTTEDELLGLLGDIPDPQFEALMALLGNESVDSLYQQIAGFAKPQTFDVDNIAAAVVAPAAQKQFHVFAEDDELASMLAQPLALWRTFLHHSQREAAYKETYKGPARVTGGAGTGKTVVAIHRAVHLAKQIGQQPGGAKPILFTTFTRNLAQSIERDIRSLGGTEALDRIDVVNVDSFSNKTVSGAEGKPVKVVDGDNLIGIWTDIADELGTDMRPSFLNAEWEQVILAQGIGSRSDYFAAARTGRGVRLDRRARAEVWKAIEAFLNELAMRGQRTFLQLANDAAGYLAGRTIRPYRHVIVDEAQDLHETQWRLLRAAVAEGPNDLFIVGDSHQRIYDRRASLSQVGINIVGRSKRLRINYRTTREILHWALAFLGEGSYDDLDTGIESQDASTYYSFLRGSRPTMASFNTKAEQLEALAAQVKSWVGGGVPETEIAVAARTKAPLAQVEAALRKAGVAATVLDADLAKADGVRLGTMHRLKGLEFRCVALVDMDDTSLPLPRAVTKKSDDEVQHKADLRRELCTAYVAATRARDDLWIGWSGNPSPFLVPLL